MTTRAKKRNTPAAGLELITVADQDGGAARPPRPMALRCGQPECIEDELVICSESGSSQSPRSRKQDLGKTKECIEDDLVLCSESGSSQSPRSHKQDLAKTKAVAPTMAVFLEREKHTIELQKQQIQHSEEKVTLLTDERAFLRGTLEEALWKETGKANPSPVQVEEDTQLSSTDSSTSSSSEEEAKRKKRSKKHKSKEKKSKKVNFHRVTTPEESIARYHKVAKLVRAGKTKAEAYEMIQVDRNTIVNQAPIAELAAVNPDKFKTLREKFNKKDSLARFASLCYTFSIQEPEASLIKARKEKDLLLDINKK